jgi:hypothetical protein
MKTEIEPLRVVTSKTSQATVLRTAAEMYARLILPGYIGYITLWQIRNPENIDLYHLRDNLSSFKGDKLDPAELQISHLCETGRSGHIFADA